MRRTAVALAALLFAATMSAASLPELFQKAKAEMKEGAWRGALTTLDQLDAESAKPGNETARQQLAAPLAFYRGVCEANLDQTEKAQAQFAVFLHEKPGATIDTAMYSKKAVAAFEAASKGTAATTNASASLYQQFEGFKSPANMGEAPDDRWADGPVKFIMTAEEKSAWTGLATGGERSEFVEKFWAKRNPKPGTDDNTARTGFDRRVAFADAYFQIDEKQRGSLTDEGMVFILLGPPSWTGRKPIMSNEERTISEGAGLQEQWWMGARNSIHIDGTSATNADGFREVWHYRKAALPAGVSASQLDVVFITKKDYGKSVLQRDQSTLSALDAARPAAKRSS